MLLFFFACSITTEDATNTCYASCDVQEVGCNTLDKSGCYGLCEWVVASIEEDPICLETAVEMWECDQLMQWECSTETTIVGQPIEHTCSEVGSEFKTQCPNG